METAMRREFALNLLGNIVWLILGGLVASLMWLIAGLLACITIVGIPFGFQCFKLAGFVLTPFGRVVEVGRFGVGGLVGNILWILLLGWELAVTHAVLGVLLTITIVGIPFGRQHFKMAELALIPFGARIRPAAWK